MSGHIARDGVIAEAVYIRDLTASGCESLVNAGLLKTQFVSSCWLKNGCRYRENTMTYSAWRKPIQYC